MDDIVNCPVCGNKMRTYRLTNKYIHFINKTGNYLERVCSKGYNHTLMFFTNDTTKCVDLLKISLKSNYSRFIEIDFVNGKSRISCMKNGKPEYINIAKIIEPDFPDLNKLREKVGMFVALS